MNISNSTTTQILIIGDSHAKNFPSRFATQKCEITTKFIRGLKWYDDRDSSLSLHSLLLRSEFKTYLSQSDRVILIIGTNSVRIMYSLSIIKQIKKVINCIRKDFVHLDQPETITICLAFPCFKVSNRFFSTFSLNSNIKFYNHELIYLSKQMGFNILDLKIKQKHLAKDQMHVDYHFQPLIFKSIIDHVNQLIEIPSTNTKTYLKSEIHVVATSPLQTNKRKRSPYNCETENTTKH